MTTIYTTVIYTTDLFLALFKIHISLIRNLYGTSTIYAAHAIEALKIIIIFARYCNVFNTASLLSVVA